MPINATWHRAHLMPKRPTAAQRLAWHLEHARECACRPLPDSMRSALTEAAREERKAKPAAASKARIRNSASAANPKPRKG
jgi:hypothetical protein